MATDTLTSATTIRRGVQTGQGTEGAYYSLGVGPGEPHVRRLDLAPAAPVATRRQTLLQFAYSTDIHIVDAESPGRFEFMDRFHGSPEMDILLPTYRPQEFLSLYAAESMFRAVNALSGSPLTGVPVQFFLSCGDQIDNGQLNELQWFIRLIEGGKVSPGSGAPAYEGVAAVAWDDPAYWHPDLYADRYKQRWGFPTYPGLLETALRPFEAQGIHLPWLICHGNHDPFLQGTAPYNTACERLVTEGRKARAVAGDWSPEEIGVRHAVLDNLLDLFIRQPEVFLTGPAQEVMPDPARRSVMRAEFLHAFHGAAGQPIGHGFSAPNLEAGTAYYVDDSWSPTVRIVVLDTVNAAGDYSGSIGSGQFAWLEEQLVEVHSRYYDIAGQEIRTGYADRLVVLVSHHPLHALTNDFDDPERGTDRPRVLAAELKAVLLRFPNLILWVNGHMHYNAITPQRDPAGRTAGFWEVTTSSLLDWPSQGRLVEVVDNENGTLSIFTTMIDHAAPADPADAADRVLRLAALHRELAANDPYAGVASNNERTPGDRNAELVLPLPF